MKRNMRRLLVLMLVLTLGFTSSIAYAGGTKDVKGPKYIFYFIGDGLGLSQRQVGELFLQETSKDKSKRLTMNTLPVTGLKTTYSANTLVTDSAAAGTALATGHKTNNGVISKTPNGKDLKTILELAEEKGYATGLVSTTRITHATPASFASHNVNRDNENEIAVDYLDSNVEFFAGGGYRHFAPKAWEYGKSKRKDDRDLLKEFADLGYNVFAGEKDSDNFLKFAPKGKEKVFAALSYSHLPYDIDRLNTLDTPSLGQLTQKGIEVLSAYEDGFFMMVEGGRIDHASHANDPVGAIHDVLAFDEAIKKACKFYEENPEDTLILVAADHETGGLGLGMSTNYFLKLEELFDVTASTEAIGYGDKKYDGNREAYFKYIEKVYSLENLTQKERTEIEKAMDLEDKGIEGEKREYGYLTKEPTAIAVAHIVSNRANIHWTTFAHSGAPIPLTAVGVNAQDFSGYNDNTMIAKKLANIIGGEL
ncbi:MAG: alkaline phosphatase [Anaeromicrobium sp.]|jgi:alkaline phosphatase|uniref:alkaline phosphatase n=1 Tax=Anaeromicrobium sp. TaxID=1929132 RepID=UPI0025F97C8D|nr:alkaline phosphatase [Anaeromicrobium sp.]MCT4594234.1 alkaline phosphatase [Anaeromicrobium sp.]